MIWDRMIWDQCVKEAKAKLGYDEDEWIDDFDEVISIAKEIYWKGSSFKRLKSNTIRKAGYECKICKSKESLTAHHIFYGSGETICVCGTCHDSIHELQNTYGFYVQYLLLGIDNQKYISSNPILMKIKKKLYKMIGYREELTVDDKLKLFF